MKLTALFVCFALLNALAGPADAQSVTSQREHAVLQARAGHRAEAISTLQRLLDSGDEDGRVAFDLATLLQDDGKSAQAAAIFARAPSDAPDYALLAATHANRSIGRLDDAERLAREGQRRFPSDSTWPLSLALVLSDANRGAEAVQVLDTSEARRAPRVEWLLARAYAYRRSNDAFAALRCYSEARRLAPANDEARREIAALLSEMGGPHAADRIVGPSPEIEASKAAAMVRWGEDVKPRDPLRRFDGTDAAIVRLGLLLQTTADPALRRRLRMDRLIALRDRFRMEEVVTEAESLKEEAPLPAYGEEAYADALLYLRHPQEAREGYRRVIKEEPKNPNARYGEFYASVELEDFDTAYSSIDALLREEPLWHTFVEDPTRYPNDEHTTAEIAAAKGRLYADELSDAWDRISSMSDAAPANPDIRITKSQVAAARGWPRLARAEAEISTSLAPDDRSAKIALAEAAMTEHRYAEADRLVAELVRLYPEDRAVQRLVDTLDAEHRWLFTLEVKPGFTSGGGANAAGQEMESSARLYTPPIADHWRAFLLDDYSYANPPEGLVTRERAGLGVEMRLPHVTASIFGTGNWGTYNRPGGGAGLNWTISDQVSVGVSGELFSADTPLRALYYGITSDEVAVRAAYRWHESRSLSLTASYQPFTDGNQRFSGLLAYEERLYTAPHFALTGLVDVGASTNSLGGSTFYFNPSADFSATAGARAEHVLWKRYDRSLTQVLQVEGGLYEERGYADDWIGLLSYEHRWRFAPRTEFHYGVELSRRVYDGAEERGIAITLGLRQRL